MWLSVGEIDRGGEGRRLASGTHLLGVGEPKVDRMLTSDCQNRRDGPPLRSGARCSGVVRWGGRLVRWFRVRIGVSTFEFVRTGLALGDERGTERRRRVREAAEREEVP